MKVKIYIYKDMKVKKYNERTLRESLSTETMVNYKSKIDTVLGLLNEILILNNSDNVRQAIQLLKNEKNSISDTGNGQSNDSNVLYFSSKYNKELTEKLSNASGAKFKVFDINGNDAKFAYIGAVINQNWIETVCDISNHVSDDLGNKTRIITTQPGTVRNENGNWIVIKRAVIRFE